VCSGWVGLFTFSHGGGRVRRGLELGVCYVVSLTWPLCTTYSQVGGRSDLRQGVSLTRRLTKSGFVVAPPEALVRSLK